MIKAIPTLVMMTCIFSFCCPLSGQSVVGKWSGTVTQRETYSGTMGTGEKTIKVTINDNVATGTITEKGQRNIGGTYICNGDCSGSGPAELHDISIDLVDQKYSIEVIGPRYNCVYTGATCEATEAAMEGISFGPSNHPLANSPNSLIGTETISYEITGGYGTVTKSVTWNLTRRMDVELIVIPANYDNWLPEPGKNEITPGTIMNINLKLQKSNGQPPTIKAKAFELRLHNTSKEPGITINAPIKPLADLPDLRFQSQLGVQVSADLQVLRIDCNNCTSASTSIASFDGGGYTTLTVIAILEDDTEVGGRLLVSGGIKEIPIPKRAPGTNMATSWRVQNNNPNDQDDKETSKGNSHDGDGLSAYEEYRGVISEGEFKRLSPKKKELGIRMKRGEFAFFSNGIRLFESETDLDVIRFFENEIDNSRKFNKNYNTAHVYDQFVLKLEKGKVTIKNAVGECRPINVSPTFPVTTTLVVVDIDKLFEYEAFKKKNGMPMLNTALEDIDVTTAHEIGHGVGITHHGRGVKYDSLVVFSPSAIIMKKNGDLILNRPYRLPGLVGRPGSEESGNLSCFMAYTEFYSWAANDINNKYVFMQVPALPLGKKLCADAIGTSINAKPNYFYDAQEGDCLGKLKLKL